MVFGANFAEFWGVCGAFVGRIGRKFGGVFARIFGNLREVLHRGNCDFYGASSEFPMRRLGWGIWLNAGLLKGGFRGGGYG